MRVIPHLITAIFLVLLCPTFLPADNPAPVEIPLFDNRFMVHTVGDTGSPRTLFFVPHFNEQNGAQAAEMLVKNGNAPRGAALFVIEPDNSLVEPVMKRDSVCKNDPPERYLYFSYQGQWYAIDPNRIYTRRGIERELLLFRDSRWIAVKELKDNTAIPEIVKDTVGKAAAQILTRTGINGKGKHPEAVVAVHNNTPTEEGSLETFSLLWYRAGGPCHIDVAKSNGTACIYEGDPAGIDNFMLVNTPEDFYAIKRDGRFNVVLLDSCPEGSDRDDGSLSVWCGRKGLRYINVEARYMPSGDENRICMEYQFEMLELVRKVVGTGDKHKGHEGEFKVTEIN